jgi:hypothetical protein
MKKSPIVTSDSDFGLAEGWQQRDLLRFSRIKLPNKQRSQIVSHPEIDWALVTSPQSSATAGRFFFFRIPWYSISRHAREYENEALEKKIYGNNDEHSKFQSRPQVDSRLFRLKRLVVRRTYSQGQQLQSSFRFAYFHILGII